MDKNVNNHKNANVENDKKNIPDMEKVIEKFKETANPNEEQMGKLKDMADKYSGKSEDELFIEIINLNKKLSEGENKEEFMKKIKKLQRIRPLLNDDQKKKLDKILKVIKES